MKMILTLVFVMMLGGCSSMFKVNVPTRDGDNASDTISGIMRNLAIGYTPKVYEHLDITSPRVLASTGARIIAYAELENYIGLCEDSVYYLGDAAESPDGKLLVYLACGQIDNMHPMILTLSHAGIGYLISDIDDLYAPVPVMYTINEPARLKLLSELADADSCDEMKPVLDKAQKIKYYTQQSRIIVATLASGCSQLLTNSELERSWLSRSGIPRARKVLAARYLAANGNPDEAIRLLKPLMQEYKDFWMLRRFYSELQLQAGNNGEAIKHATDAFLMAPPPVKIDYSIFLADILLKSDYEQGAIKALRMAASLSKTKHLALDSYPELKAIYSKAKIRTACLHCEAN